MLFQQVDDLIAGDRQLCVTGDVAGVDVRAVRDGTWTGIEFETGNSDAVSNVKNCLRSRFGRIIGMATSDKTVSKIERQLAKARLLIPNRVEVVLRDQWKHMTN